MQKKNCATTLICAAVFLFFFVKADSLKPAAAHWPQIICVVGLALAGLELLLEGIKWMKNPEKQENLWVLRPEQTKRSLVLLGLVILWIAGLNSLGFLVSSVLALCVIALIFEPKKTRAYIIRDVLVCAVFGVAFYFMFNLLGIHFPRSLLI